MIFLAVDFTKIHDVNQILHIDTAIERAEHAMNGNHNGHPPKLEYFLHPDGHLALCAYHSNSEREFRDMDRCFH